MNRTVTDVARLFFFEGAWGLFQRFMPATTPRRSSREMLHFRRLEEGFGVDASWAKKVRAGLQTKARRQLALGLPC